MRIRCGIFESVFRLQDDIRGWLENNKCRFLLFNWIFCHDFTPY
ncbi:hypothetical protein COPCOM_03566 [Coprococcus comes ATCC 27758]|uniref:Uncharacterized protein n=1 Tax=Coprococcus comes ATCC 27758 TaxID=470146 RepID=C0BEF4_9FIRM|nr:hypothetical protein COPCOM_03566 [Coprococcus comes ATCC 27758]